MMCIVLRGKDRDGFNGNDFWQGLRSVEILGYHHKEKRCNILLVLYLQNKLSDGEENFLYMLHPGNVTATLGNPWPAPHHPDVEKQNGTEFLNGTKLILESVYGKAFREDDETGQVYQTSGLSTWDSWYPQDDEPVEIFWPKEKNTLGKDKLTAEIPRVFPKTNTQSFSPFNVFELGPFTKRGAVLIAVNSVVQGESYDKLLGDRRAFTIDGPETLLSRIKHEYIPLVQNEEEKNKWNDVLRKFRRYVGFGESYDVITIQPPYADKLEYIDGSGIIKAPEQPPQELAERYISGCHGFTLCLKSPEPVEDIPAIQTASAEN